LQETDLQRYIFPNANVIYVIVDVTKEIRPQKKFAHGE
jgi:hypothetical protein